MSICLCAGPLDGKSRRILERVLDRNTGRQEVSDIACHDGQPILQCGCGDQQIGAAVTNPRAEASPSTRDPRVDREDAIAIGFDSAIEPGAKSLGENRVLNLLSNNTPFDLADGDR